MFLTSLTLKGFKSFADKTTLEVEPGITVIVGPNGSGKSNVVDALAWVLGTHSAKKVRGGQMADVIFAGSPSRPALGRAQVEIVIDNSAGQLGTDAIGTAASAQGFAEVRVSREILATGENVYRINGEEVRALDVQELLSDTGLGRELHTIVGQGQLDAILNAKPEDRRAYIEEAAGILKHRRRRERALRKLEQVDAHIDKLKSILRELRRQLRPLERQAEAADKHQALQAQLRDVQLRIAAHDLARVGRRLERDAEHESETRSREDAAEAAVAEQRRLLASVEQTLAVAQPAAEQASHTAYELQSLRERLRGTADLIEAKRRHLIEYVDEPLAGRPPDELRAQAERADGQRATRQQERDEARATLEALIAQRREAESARRDHEQLIAAEARRRAEQRERVLRWEGEVSALRGAIASTEAEVGRIASQLQGLDGRVTEADAEVDKVQHEIQRLDASEVDLTATLERAEDAVTAAQTRVDELVARERDLERERSSQSARAEALRAALADHGDDGTDVLLQGAVDGVLGAIASLVRVEAGAEPAVAAALGPLGEAVLVSSPDRARRAIAHLRAEQAGSAVVLAARDTDPEPLDADTAETLRRAGAVAVGTVLAAREGETAQAAVVALRRALASTFIVRDWDTAVLLHGRQPSCTFVTEDGDVAGPWGYRGGRAPERSAVQTATAAEDAERRAAALAVELATLRDEAGQAQEELASARAELRAATEAINESDAAITGAAERLARLNKELHALANQRQVVAAQYGELRDLLERDRSTLSELNARGPESEPIADAEDPALAAEAQRLDAVVEEARERELEQRVRVERITEQVRHLELQAGELRREAEEVEAALAEAARRREARRHGIVRCGDLQAVCSAALDALERSLADAAATRDRLADEVRGVRGELATIREALEQRVAELEEVRESRHAADLRRAELRHEHDELVARIRKDFGLGAAEVAAEHPDALDEDRPALVETEDVLIRRIGLLGRINPLALEEFHALEQRHAFLAEQLEDLRASKRDLEEVVVAVDERIREVFREAFEEVAAAFEDIFDTVFPGGEGRLVLTDPDDLLTTGIEVEARPPGKKVKRLSLLSGGERSLTVLAFVFAIFRARPSPFYVLDEVDAALDDVNLQRLLRVIERFRGASQIIMVTHQKRSMECADLLYGITMGPDAVTKVVAERLDDIDDLDARAADGADGDRGSHGTVELARA